MSSRLGSHSNGQPQQLVVRLLPPLLERGDFYSQFAQYFPRHDSVSHMYYVRGENPSTPYEKPVYLRAYLTFNLAIAYSSCQAALADKPFVDIDSNDSMVPQLQHGLFCKLWERPPPVSAEPKPLFAESSLFQQFVLLLPAELTNYDIMTAAKKLRASGSQKKKKSKKDTQRAKESKSEKPSGPAAASKITALQKKGAAKTQDEQKSLKKSKKQSKREKLNERKAIGASANDLTSNEKGNIVQTPPNESALKPASSTTSKKQAKKQRALEKAQSSQTSPIKGGSALASANDQSNEHSGNSTKTHAESSLKAEKSNNSAKNDNPPKKGVLSKSPREGLDSTKTVESGKGLAPTANDTKSKKKRQRPKKPAKPTQPQT